MNKKLLIRIIATINIGILVAAFILWNKEKQRQSYLRIMIVHSFVSSSVAQYLIENKSTPESWKHISHWPEKGIFEKEDYLRANFIKQNVGFLPGVKPSTTNEMKDVRLWLNHHGSKNGNDFSYSINGERYGLPVLWFFHKVPFKGLSVSFTDLDWRTTVSYSEFGHYIEEAFRYAESHGIDYDKTQLDYWKERKN